MKIYILLYTDYDTEVIGVYDSYKAMRQTVDVWAATKGLNGLTYQTKILGETASFNNNERPVTQRFTFF